MAAVQPQSKPAPTAKYDAFVEAQLARAIRRIRLLDAASAAVSLVAATALYALAMTLVDAWMGLSPLTRGLALAAYFLGALTFLTLALVRAMFRSVNPRYAALQVERVLPGAKNSVVNWVDLHDRNMPAAIRHAVIQRAAREVAHFDLDRAVSARRTVIVGAAAGVLVLATVAAMLVVGPPKFFSRLQRAFLPLGGTTLASNTQLRLVTPDGGNATVPMDRPVVFTVEVTGHVPEPGRPDSARLLYRFRQDEPFVERPLDRETQSEWRLVLSAAEIQGNGIWYKLAAGDAETPEYRVTLRPRPLVASREVTYHYRPYLGRKDVQATDPTVLEGLRGTRVTLVARTNQPIRTAIHPITRQSIKGELQIQLGAENQTVFAAMDNDPQALHFDFVLDHDGKQHLQSGKYQVRYTSADGDESTAGQLFDVAVERDEPPTVELRKAEKDALPANGLLHLNGEAHDDVGIKDLALQLQVVGGPRLGAVAYRPEKDFHFHSGGYPREIGYQDLVGLDKLKDAEGKPYGLRPGMVLEYWLEARDDCDYPEPLHGQTGASQHFRVSIEEAAKDPKAIEKQRQKAEQEKKAFQQSQDKALKNQEQRDAQGGEGTGEGKTDPSNPDQSPKPQPGDGSSKDAQANNAGGHEGGQEKNGQNDSKDPGQAKRDEIRKRAENALAGNKADSKGEGQPQPSAEGKDKGEPGQQPDKGDAKGNGERQPRPDAGQAKSGEGANGQKPDAGQEKQPGAPGGEQHEGKAKDQQPAPGAAQGRAAGQPETRPEQENEAKGTAQGDAGKQAGQGKNADKNQADPVDSAEAKQGAQASPQGGKCEGSCKGAPETAAGASKGAAKPGTSGSASAKGANPQGGAGDQGSAHPASPETSDSANLSRGDTKGGNGPKDPQQAARQAQHDPSQWQSLIDDLEKRAREAKDDKARAEAQKTLDDIKKLQQESTPSTSKSEPPGSNHGSAVAKGSSGEQKPEAGQGKDGGGSKPGDQGSGRGQSKDRQQPGGKDGAGQTGDAKGPAGTKNGHAVGLNDNGHKGSDGSSGPNDPRPAPSDQAGEDYRKRAGDLQLVENVARHLSADDLKAAGISPEDWDRFRKDAAHAAAAPKEKAIGDNTPSALPPGSQLPDLGPTQSTDPTTRTGDAGQGGRGHAPPGIWRQREEDYDRDRARAAGELEKK